LLIAGVDTSSIAMEWAMASLVKNQEAMKKLQSELETKLGIEAPIQDSHLVNLPYLEACIKETLRLQPPGPLLLPHRALETCEVMGYTIPKDSIIYVNMWTIGHDPDTWKDPLRFEPQRFLDNRLDFKGMDFEYLPFGSGRRLCPGQPSAIRQNQLILSSLVYYFDWSLPEDKCPSELDMSESFVVTMNKKVPLELIPKVRKKSLFGQIEKVKN